MYATLVARAIEALSLNCAALATQRLESEATRAESVGGGRRARGDAGSGTEERHNDNHARAKQSNDSHSNSSEASRLPGGDIFSSL